MPKITDIQIQKNNKTRANIYVEGQYSFALEMLTVMKAGLKIGAEVTDGFLADVVYDNEVSVGFERAVTYLSRSMRTRKQTYDYLVRKGYADKVIDAVLDKLADYKFIDDNDYAKRYVENNMLNKGERRIKQELKQRGVPVSVIDEYCVVPDNVSQDNAEALAEKYMRGKPRDLKTLQKLQRYLLSRGYGFDVAGNIIRKYKTDDNV